MRRLAELKQEIGELARQEIPAVLGELEELKAAAWAQLLTPTNGSNPAATKPQDDRWLTAAEAAALLRVTPRWLYRHQKKLPFARQLSRKCLRFSEAGLRRWQANK